MNARPELLSWEDAVVWLRNQPDRQHLVIDGYYDDPLIAAAERYRASSEWQEIAQLLHGRAGKALDIGAGRGIASYALAKEGFEVTALEPDPSAIVGAGAIRLLAAEAALPINIIEEFSERLPFADGTFDFVHARAVLHHMSDLDIACSEIFRVLRSGGLLVAAREHVISRERDLDAFLAAHPLHHLYGGEHAYRLDRYVDALKGAGFGSLQVLSPLKSPINLFPHTLDTLREAILERVSQKIPGRPLWRLLLRRDRIFRSLLAAAERFDHRPGRLYSFVGHKVVS
jgi:SAM-dependent methyltransferase